MAFGDLLNKVVPGAGDLLERNKGALDTAGDALKRQVTIKSVKDISDLQQALGVPVTGYPSDETNQALTAFIQENNVPSVRVTNDSYIIPRDTAAKIEEVTGYDLSFFETYSEKGNNIKRKAGEAVDAVKSVADGSKPIASLTHEDVIRIKANKVTGTCLKPGTTDEQFKTELDRALEGWVKDHNRDYPETPITLKPDQNGHHVMPKAFIDDFNKGEFKKGSDSCRLMPPTPTPVTKDAVVKGQTPN